MHNESTPTRYIDFFLFFFLDVKMKHISVEKIGTLHFCLLLLKSTDSGFKFEPPRQKIIKNKKKKKKKKDIYTFAPQFHNLKMGFMWVLISWT